MCLRGSAADSETDITNNTTATIGDDTKIAVIGSISNPGAFVVSAYNDVEAADWVDLDSGGLIDGAAAVSEIRADNTNATASIGNSDKITTIGDVDVQAYTQGILNVQPKVHTYGLAAAASIDGLARMHESDAANVGMNTNITAQGNLNLLSGQTASGTENNFNVTSHGDELNASAIPIDSLKSHGEVIQNNTVSIGTGSNLESAGDANLIAQTMGNDIITAYGEGKNWMSDLASGINSALGGTPIPTTMQGGTSTLTATGTITVNGTVTVGINDQQSIVIPLNINEPGGAVTATAGITYTTDVESQSNNLMMELKYWEDLANTYAGTTAGAAYLSEVTMVEQQMKQLGLTQTIDETPGDASTATTVYLTSYAAPYITISNITADEGAININGTSLNVNGTLTASGNVSVIIDNKSPDNLRVEGIDIPDNAQAGEVLWNYRAIGNSDLMNGTAGVSGSGTIVDNSSGNAAQPSVTITSEFSSADQTGNYALSSIPDIELDGNIDNLLGSVTVTNSAGSIITNGSISAKSVSITAGGNYIQNYSNALTSVGGVPGSSSGWQAVFALAQADAVNSLPKGAAGTYSTSGSASDLSSAVSDAMSLNVNPPSQSIVAGENVYIAAQYLNINGIVQSGQPDQKVTIETSVQSQINEANAVYKLLQQGNTTAAQNLVSSDKLTTTDLTSFKLTTDSGDTIEAFYNAQTQQIDLAPVKVQGGYMQLVGQIASTGGGQLNVLDGYGTINITNDTSYALVTNLISTGQGAAGDLLITDTSYTKSFTVNGKTDVVPLTTEYAREDGRVTVDTYYVDSKGVKHEADPSADSNAQTVVNNADPTTRTAVYTPASGQRYYWTEGEDFMTTTSDTYSTSVWLGISAFYSPSNIVSSNTVVTDGVHLESGGYIGTPKSTDPASGTNFYMNAQESVTGSPQTQKGNLETDSTWYGKTTYTQTTTTETGTEDTFLMSIKADDPINIDFKGYDTGNVNITSVGSVMVDNAIQNANGSTTIISSAGRIEQGSAQGSIGGQNVSLSAATGIGTSNPLAGNLTAPLKGPVSVLNATSTTGNMAIKDANGNMNIGRIASGTPPNPAGDIALTAAGSIYASSSSSEIIGGEIALTANGGNIGTFGSRAPGTIRPPTPCHRPCDGQRCDPRYLHRHCIGQHFRQGADGRSEGREHLYPRRHKGRGSRRKPHEREHQRPDRPHDRARASQHVRPDGGHWLGGPDEREQHPHRLRCGSDARITRPTISGTHVEDLVGG